MGNETGWQRNVFGEIEFVSTGDAVEYAKMVYDIPAEIEALTYNLSRNKKEYSELNARWVRMADEMMQVATRGQLLRECLEEIERIRAGEPDTNKS